MVELQTLSHSISLSLLLRLPLPVARADVGTLGLECGWLYRDLGTGAWLTLSGPKDWRWLILYPSSSSSDCPSQSPPSSSPSFSAPYVLHDADYDDDRHDNDQHYHHHQPMENDSEFLKGHSASPGPSKVLEGVVL